MSFSGVRIRTRRYSLLPSMAAASSPPPSFSSVTALVLAILLCQMCVRCHCTRAALAAASWPSPETETRPPPSIIHPTVRARLLQKYFRRGFAAGGGGDYKFAGGGGGVFEESKRKIASCPDPLHN